MFRWREEPAPGVHLAVTDRRGGVSSGPYARLNLGGHVGDDPGAVAENRRRVAEVAGVPVNRLVAATQVHGNRVAEVDVGWPFGAWPAAPTGTSVAGVAGVTGVAGVAPEADALVTRLPGVVLTVLVADCVPVLLADPAAGVLGVAHAGRRGLAGGVVPRLIETMRDLGARRLVARVGPSVCGRCYEVPAPLRDEVAGVVPVARAVTRAGTPALDVAAGVVEQLAPHCADLAWLAGCTAEDADLFSYRRDGITGRLAGLAWLR